MPATKRELMILKRRLFAVRTEMQALATEAQRMGEDSLAWRLLNIVRRLTGELDFVDNLLGRLP